jgi:predicted ATPase/DNA-binding CsgD family transcriptional regulator
MHLTAQQAGGQDAGAVRVEVGSDAWFEWLELATSFRFVDEVGQFTAQKTHAGNRRGQAYWRATRRRHGRLASYYLGASKRLTPEHLRQAALALAVPGGDDQREPPSVMVGFRRTVTPPARDTATGHDLAPPSQLPRPLTRLLGRASERAKLVARLRRPEVRLLTLTGPGGGGKTRLALEAAKDLMPDFSGRVYFVSLSAISDPAFVLPAIMQSLGLRETGRRTLLEDLQAGLGDQPLLLLLDNFEQVVEAAASLADLLAVCPQVKLLVTSRAALRLSGEHELVVLPLALPDLGQAPTAHSLLRFAACALFIERVQAIQPAFQLTAATVRPIVEICRRLDGLPLAIELAAAHARLLSPRALLSRLAHRLDVLTGGMRNAPDRQQTMRATIAWSYQLLPASQQKLFRWLAVFVDGCTLEAVEAVIRSAGPHAAPHILEGVHALVENHLLRQVEQPDGEPRLLMLQTIRDFGLECLEDDGELEAARAAHAAYYLALAEEVAPQLRESDQIRWMGHLEREQENLRGALGFLLEQGHLQSDEHEQEEGVVLAERSLRLCVALYGFWHDRGYVREGQAFLERALAQHEDVAPQLRARALYAAAGLASSLDDLERVERLCGESLALSRSLGDTAGIAFSLAQLGQMARVRGHYALARSQLEESAGLCAQLSDRWMQGLCQVELARIATEQGQYERAGALLSDNLQVSQAAGDTMSVHWVQYLLARLLFLQYQDVGRAQQLAEQSLAFYQEHGYAWFRAYALTLLARMRLAQGTHGGHAADGDLALAGAWFEEGLALVQEVGDREGSIEALLGLAQLALVQGDLSVALRRFQDGQTILHELGSQAFLAANLEGMAAIEATQGTMLQAARLWGTAEGLRELIGTPMHPVDRAAYEHTSAQARLGLGELAFRAAWAEGRLMTPEQALMSAPEPGVSPTPPLLARGAARALVHSPSLPFGLTAREVEVLRLLSQGLSDAQIAVQLVISVRTVNRHTTSLYSKLGVSSRAAAARAALEQHLLFGLPSAHRPTD